MSDHQQLFEEKKGESSSNSDDEQQHIDTDADAADTTTAAIHHQISTTTSKQRYKRRHDSGRHGARNQNRHKNLVKWILQAFPHLSSSSSSSSTNNTHILDVAGGKGELAARLSMCHAFNIILVDPRPADIADCFLIRVLPKLPKKWQQRISQQQESNPTFVQDTVNSRCRQLTMHFDEYTVKTSTELQHAIRNASLLIGIHADGATEAIVDTALEYGKPFLVCPCCVFPKLFSQRVLLENDGSETPVRSHEQFCEYLLRKDKRLVMETLPFEGRNTAIWWDGRADKST
jgi:hypothetical protein